jgi:amino acid adenylation domain-containing protein/non-ribosomal peptide synthase protein (TIGR01720 family)
MQNTPIAGFPISPQQKRLCLLWEKTDFQVYRTQGQILIAGNIDYSLLKTAIQKAINRHEILRTKFTILQGMTIPLQVIEESGEVVISYNDLSGLGKKQQNTQLTALFEQQKQVQFNLEQGQVLSIKVTKLSKQKFILIITISSLCADVNSVSNLVTEIYNNCLSQKEIINEPLQYADIAAWQNELFAENQPKKDYWRKQNILDSIQVKLPSEKINQESRFNPQSSKINLATELLTKVEAFVNSNTASISTVLMACWYILLWRLVEQKEIAIATYVDGRNYEELKPALGLLAKYLPVQINLEETITFSQVLTQLTAKIEEVERWQEFFNWEELIASSDRESSFLPFAFEFIPQFSKYSNDNITLSLERLYSCIEPFKVKLSCWYQNDSLITELHYDANLFATEDIERLIAEFQTLVTNAVAYPETAIAQLDILSPEERQQLIIDFNQTKNIISPHECIHHWFEAQVNNHPHQIAVVCEQQQLTYQQLNLQAEQIANHLVSLGIKPDAVVALCVERSLDIAIGILGILKAGAAYLPLEPSLPSEALAFRLQDAQVSVLLTQKHLVDKTNQLPIIADNQIQIFCIDELSLKIKETEVERSPVTTNNLAYIIYTSGSTGQPKGVAVEHRQVINYLNGILEKLNLPVDSSFATVSTFAADLGNTAIFSALCSGGALHIITEDRATDPVALADYFNHHQIDCLKIVPSHLSALLTYAHPEQILPRQRLILGGEALTWELIEQVQKFAPTCQIYNHYGPTETAIGVLLNPINYKSEPKYTTVPLGRPLANSQIYLLDKYQKPVPLGVPGEIYIGGDSVTRGYLNRPELTQEKFIPNPIPPTPLNKGEMKKDRLYRTGDLARYHADGNLEFLGRVDDQIKLNGFRIELGEIEAVLQQHPQVRDVIVLAREDKLDQKKLVAYLVFEANSTEDNLKDVRALVAEKLPEYMIPAHFVRLKALPLTSNGKVDRKALPAPDEVKPELQGKFVAPTTPVEITLAKIWSELLGIEQVGIHDNFFELGGDSIISIQAIARANQVGLRLTPKQIFEHQTIAKLAVYAGTSTKIESEQGLVTGLVPLTPIQLSLFQQNLPHPHHWNQSVLLELKQNINPLTLPKIIYHLLQHHDALRMSFRQETDGWQALIDDSEPKVLFTRLDFKKISQQHQKTAIEAASAQTQASLDLAKGELVRVVFFDLGKMRSPCLLIAIHHLVVDTVSWRILLSDLQTALEQLNHAEKVQLPAKTTSFKHWSESLQEYAKTKKLNSEMDYWRSQLNTSISPLPKDNPKGSNSVSQTSVVSVCLDETETQALLQQVPAKYNTQINDVLLTALVQAFTAWTKERTLLVNLEGHGREEIISGIDLSRTVGWFTTLFPVLLDLGDTVSIGDALKSIKEQLRSIPNRGIGYGILRYLNRNLPINDRPQAEICFNYLGQFDRVLPDASLFSIAPESNNATRSPLGDRPYLIEINGFIAEGKLQLNWAYSQEIYQKTTVLNLAQRAIASLQNIITHCQSSEAGGYTPSDFPQANLNQKDLDHFLAKISRGK